jgi:hypothetical protein
MRRQAIKHFLDYYASHLLMKKGALLLAWMSDADPCDAKAIGFRCPLSTLAAAQT